MITIPGTIELELMVSDQILELELGSVIEITTNVPEYEGPYEVTPTQQVQIINTDGLLLTGDLTIKPIPSNYGKIGWNGSVLTVS